MMHVLCGGGTSPTNRTLRRLASAQWTCPDLCKCSAVAVLTNVYGSNPKHALRRGTSQCQCQCQCSHRQEHTKVVPCTNICSGTSSAAAILHIMHFAHHAFCTSCILHIMYFAININHWDSIAAAIQNSIQFQLQIARNGSMDLIHC
jgi:hypothetical protein